MLLLPLVGSTTRAAIVLEQWAAAAQQGNTLIAATFPATPTEGNLLVAIAGNRGSSVPPSTPAGWSLALEGTGNAPGQLIYYKIAGASEPTSLTIGPYSIATSLGMHFYEYSGVNTSAPLASSKQVDGSGTTVSTGNVSTAENGALILFGVAVNADTDISGWTNGFVEEWDFVNGGGPLERSTYAGADLVTGAAGTYSTSGTLGTAGNWIGQVVVFDPEPPPPGANVVTNTNNSGVGSLRAAIDYANLNPGTTVTFDIPDSDLGYQTNGTDHWWRIAPTVGLPSISANGTTIDGTTQTTNRGDTNTRGPEIEINGATIPAASGLTLTSADGWIRGIVLNGFTTAPGTGILLDGASAIGNRITGCYIGANAVGDDEDPNFYGITLFDGVSGTVIGEAGEGNVISGNDFYGIHLDSAGANTTIRGNRIGTNATGDAAMANSNGIYIDGGTAIVVGGPGVGEGNLISGNITSGMNLQYGDDVTIQGNWMGLNLAGTDPLPDGGTAIYGWSVDNVTIGGSAPGEGNIIAGNDGYGISLGAGCQSWVIQGNTIGAGPLGTETNLGNAGAGNIRISPNDITIDVTVGGENPGEGNLIAYAGGPGITCVSLGSVVKIVGNVIRNNAEEGINARVDSLTVAMNLIYDNGAGFDGILLQDVSSDGKVFQNTIHDSGDDGIEVVGTGHVIRNNIITGSTGYGINLNSGTMTESNNDVTGAATSPANALGRSNVALDASDIDADPLYTDAVVGDFSLIECTSPAINAGLDLGGDQPDMNGGDSGNFNGAAPDMGASETSCLAAGYDISGTVFEDVNFAGTAYTYDGGTTDALIDSVDVELYDADNADAFVATTATGRTATGVFSFTGLSDGNYKVRVRSATIGLIDSAPAGGLNGTVPASWPYPLAEMTWGDGAALYGGQSATVDDTDTGDNAGPGDTYVAITVSGGDVTGVDFGFAYNLIVHTADDGLGNTLRSDQGSLRQFLKNANAIGAAGGTTANASEFRMQVAANQSDATDSWWRISPVNALPYLSDGGTKIDGSTQALNSGTDSNTRGPELEIDGALVNQHGMFINSSGNEIRGLIINGFDDNWQAGIYTAGAGASGNTIAGNYIGTNFSTTTSIPNYYGIRLSSGSTGNTIGGSSVTDRNVVSGNAEDGIVLSGPGTSSNTVRGNYVGTNAAGTGDLGNGGDGIEVASDATDNIVGGTVSADRNVIAGNSGQGIYCTDAHGTIVRGNYIGINVTGIASIPNNRGVWVGNGSTGSVIGGSVDGARNVISGNSFRGIVIGNVGTSGTVVQGNYIGCDSTGMAARPNIGPGIEIQFSATNSTIGGSQPGQGNVIAFNTGDGIYISGADTDGHLISGNAIFSNNGLGIDLATDGIGADDGSNNSKAAPTILSITPSGSDLNIVASVASADTVEFFRVNNEAAPAVGEDPTGYGEGFLYLGRCVDGGNCDGPHVVDGPDGDGNPMVVQATVEATGLSSGDGVSAVATDASGNSSEFSDNVTAPGTHDITGLVFEDADYAGAASNWDAGIGDAALPNVDVELYSGIDSSFVATTATNGSGQYSFTGVSDGSYLVRVRSATIGDADTPPAGGLNGTVPGTWPYPLSEMTWANDDSLYGGQDATVDDADTGDDAGIGDTHVTVTVSGADLTDVNFGFAYNLIVNTLDDGIADNTRSDQGSLRQFLKSANAISGTQISVFRIPNSDSGYNGTGNGEYTIIAADELPTSRDPVILDGTTQTGFATTPLIEIDGGSILAGVDGVTIKGGGSTVRGLVINSFWQNAVVVDSLGGNTIIGNVIGLGPDGGTIKPNFGLGVVLRTGSNHVGGLLATDLNVIAGNMGGGIDITGVSATGNTVRGNYIGTDETGTLDKGNSGAGIVIANGASGNTIGGAVQAARNVISGNSGVGISLTNLGTTGNTILGNHIGTDRTGLLDLGNNADGISILSSASGNTIGGTSGGSRNIISGNGSQGIMVDGPNTTGNEIIGNYIGVDSTGASGIPNSHDGIILSGNANGNSVGGTTPGAGNIIAFNGGDGVFLTAADTDDNPVLGNAIFANTGLGIDLNVDDVTLNDAGDVDTGANDELNFPEITSAWAAGGTVNLGFDLEAPAGNYRIEFFKNPTGVDATNGEGEVLVSAVTINHGGTGVESFSHSCAGAAGDTLTATATDSLLAGGYGSTSEFSEWYPVSVASTYELSGRVFEDADFGGTASTYDGGVNDALVDSVDVELYDADNADALVASTVTGRATTGTFTFSGLSDGNYKVRVRSATIGDTDSPPVGGLNGTVPATWPYPLPELSWANGGALYGGQSATADDTDTGDDAGPGDTYVAVLVSGADVSGVDFGFAYNLIVHTADDGLADSLRSDQGSLRQFIKNANAIGSAGGTTANASEFRIPNTDPGYNGSGNGEYTVAVGAALPLMDDPVILDAQTQTGWLNDPIMELDGSGAGAGVDGLAISGGASVVRGFVIRDFTGNGIRLSGSGGDSIQANFIGTDVTGVLDARNDKSGIDLAGTAAAGTLIGGVGDGDGNLIAFNWERGIFTSGGSGGEISGNTVHSHGYSGIVSTTADLLIAKNVIYGNSSRTLFDEIEISGGNEVYQNTIHGAAGDGISVEGAGAVLHNNIVTGCAGFGVRVGAGTIASESHNLITDSSVALPASVRNGLGRISAGSLDPTDLNMDPLYVDAPGGDFSLTECASPSINTGLDLDTSQPDVNGTDSGNFNGIAPDQGAVESSCLGLTLAITKRAFLADGTPVATGTVVPRGTPIKYLLYINNTGPARTDVSVRDVLDAAFDYQSTSIKEDASVPACVTGTCSAAEEVTIFTVVDGRGAGTDGVDGDTVSYTVGTRTVDAGNSSQANARLDIPANSVYALLFEVKVR